MARSFRLEQIRLSAVIAVGIAAGLGIWLGTRDSGGGHNPVAQPPTGVTGTTKQVVPVTSQSLQALASALKHPVYWAGEMPSRSLELTQLSNGQLYLRYLPPGIKVGSAQAELTIGTYPVADALAAVERSAGAPKAVRLSAPGGGVAFYTSDRPTNVFLAFPGAQYEVEVFDPNAAQARSLVTTGKVTPVPTPLAAPSAKIVSAADLKAAARSASFPVYWAGPKAGSAYELSQTSGRFYIRYLPAGTKAGANVSALTVGTYPVDKAFSVVQGLAARSGSVQVPVTGGAIAFYAKSSPTSVYIAFPGANVEVEVFDPSPAGARQLVTSGKIVPVR